MHAASASRSERLQLLLRALRLHPEGLTTHDLATLTGSVAVHSDVAELRASTNGYSVSCSRERSTTGGRSVYRYRLLGRRAA